VPVTLLRRTCMWDGCETLRVTHIVLVWCGRGQSHACVGASALQALLLLLALLCVFSRCAP